MTNEQSEMARKVRALLAKANGTENEAEAAAFAAKAQELLNKHNLDLEAIMRQGGTGEEVTEVLVKTMYTDIWRISIFHEAAELYFCKIYIDRWVDDRGGKYKVRKGVKIVGKPHNLAVAEPMIEYLISTVRHLSTAYSKQRAEYLAFERGCGMRIAERLRIMNLEAQERAAREAGHLSIEAAASAGGNLPALIRSELALADSFMDKLGLSKTRASSTNVGGDHAAAGRAAGDKVSFSGQVGGSRGGHLLG